MRDIKLKGQALALVLIVIAVSVVIAYGITSRVIEDIQQQGEEKASTRAETFSENAVESLSQQIISGELTSADFGNSSVLTKSLDELSVCDPNSQTQENQCDQKSTAEVTLLPHIIQFKLFSSESIEVHMTDPSKLPRSNLTVSHPIMIHLKSSTSFPDVLTGDASMLIKTFYYEGDKTQVGTECVVKVNKSTDYYSCIPQSNSLRINRVDCKNQKVDIIPLVSPTNESILSEKMQLGDDGQYCFRVEALHNIGFYRIKPLLPESTANPNEVPYIDMSVTGVASNNYKLPENQMAIIQAGAYTGQEGSDREVFQQATKFILIHKAVPEVADYVLYNGSGRAIQKGSTMQ